MFKLTDDVVKNFHDFVNGYKKDGNTNYISVGTVDDPSNALKFVYRIGIQDYCNPDEEEIFETQGLSFVYLKSDKPKIEGTEFAVSGTGEDARLDITAPNKENNTES